MKKDPQKSQELEIEKVVYGGKGLGSFEGKKTFVGKTIAGDKVCFNLTKESKNYNEGTIKKFIKKSPHRTESPCTYSNECGGCQWMSVKKEKQIEYKKEFIRESFKRIGKTNIEQEIKLTTSQKPYHYRNRILLRATLEERKLQVGFFKDSSHTQIHIKKCMIAHPAHNELIKYINQSVFKNTRKQKLRLEVQVLPKLSNENKPCLLITLHPIEKNHDLLTVLTTLKKYSQTLWVSYKEDQTQAPLATFETHQGLTYYTKPGIFQQINTETNQVLREKVKKIIQTLSPQNILDLYCGSGNLSLGLSNKNTSVLGVEFNKESIEVAKYNIKINGLKNIKYLAKNVSKFLKENLTDLKAIDFIIIDPPRKGVKEDLSNLLKLEAQHILYISCDPATAARDFGVLSSNYKLKDLVAFDFFPQTYHVETLILLERKSLNP